MNIKNQRKTPQSFGLLLWKNILSLVSFNILLLYDWNSNVKKPHLRLIKGLEKQFSSKIKIPLFLTFLRQYQQDKYQRFQRYNTKCNKTTISKVINVTKIFTPAGHSHDKYVNRSIKQADVCASAKEQTINIFYITRDIQKSSKRFIWNTLR